MRSSGKKTQVATEGKRNGSARAIEQKAKNSNKRKTVDKKEVVAKKAGERKVLRKKVVEKKVLKKKVNEKDVLKKKVTENKGSKQKNVREKKVSRKKDVTVRKTSSKKTKVAKEIQVVEAKSFPTRKSTVFVVGSGDMGNLGLGEVIRETAVPVPLPGLTEIEDTISVSAGGIHSSAVFSKKGKAYTWGTNDNFNCGRPTEKPTPEYDYEDELLPGPLVHYRGLVHKNQSKKKSDIGTLSFEDKENAEVVLMVTNGNSHGVMLTSLGRVYIWGLYKTWSGSQAVQYESPTLVEALLSHRVVHIASGEDFDLAVTDQGLVFEWGSKLFPEVEPESTDIEDVRIDWMFPHLVDTVVFPRRERVTKVFAGLDTRYMVTDAGSVAAWGLNSSGQAGFIPSREVPHENVLVEPRKIEALSGIKIVKISGGQRHALSLSEQGQVWVWGMSEYGQLGAPSDGITEPRHLVIEKSAVDIATGTNHSIVVLSEGRPLAFGSNVSLELGVVAKDSEGNPMDEVREPTPIQGKHISNYEIYGASASSEFSLFVGYLKPSDKE